MGQQLCPCTGQNNNLFELSPIYITSSQFHEVIPGQAQLKIIQKLTQNQITIQSLLKLKFHVNKNSQILFVGFFDTKQASNSGVYYISQKLIYYGNFAKGVPYGNGTIKRIKKINDSLEIFQSFKGQFVDGVANGSGIYKNFQYKFTFDGKWQQKKTPYPRSIPIHGVLTLWDNHQIQSVQFLNFQHKDAIILYKQGNKYIGFIDQKRLCPNGVGKMIFQFGDVYEGEWKVGKIHGSGIYKWKTGQIYTGNYKQGLKDGDGILNFPQGNKFMGIWKNGKKNGLGKCINEKGLIIKQGIWIDDKINQQKSKQIHQILQRQKMPIKDLVSQLQQNSRDEHEEAIQRKIDDKINELKQEQQKYVDKIFNSAHDFK